MVNKLIYIRHASHHHSGYSGYSKLLDYIPGEVVSETNAWVPYWIRKVLANSVDQRAGLYDSRSVQKELALSFQMLKKRNGLAHFLNGERDIRFSTSVKKMRAWNFVATFHKPPDVLRKTLPDLRYVRKLDGAVAVGMNQVEILSEIVGSGAVEFIPHGIDTDFFTPSAQDWDAESILFVGYHLRDFETLASVLPVIQKRFPRFQLHAVVDKHTAHKLPTMDNVVIHAKITDEMLLSLYQRSAALLIPLKDVTACNSILEALACGVPIVTTRLAGHTGYLNEHCSFQIEKGNVKAMADAVIELMENRALNQAMRLKCRAQSSAFAWPVVAAQMTKYYSKHFGYSGNTLAD